MPDRELEAFKRDIHLVEYAKKAGFEPSPYDPDRRGLTFLEHPNRDAIVVARNPRGHWIYACIADCPPRGQPESEADAVERLRAHIERTRDKGTIVEFVRHRDCTARSGEVDVETVRVRLREFQEWGTSLDTFGALRPPALLGRHPSDREVTGDVPRAPDGLLSRNQAAPELGGEPGSGDKVAFHKRSGDGLPALPGSGALDAHERIRRWQEAQGAIDEKVRRAHAEPPPARDGREVDSVRRDNVALGQAPHGRTPAGGDRPRARPLAHPGQDPRR